MLVFIGLHVLVVLAIWLVKRENLIRPMITGRKPAARCRRASASPARGSGWRYCQPC